MKTQKTTEGILKTHKEVVCLAADYLSLAKFQIFLPDSDGRSFKGQRLWVDDPTV